MNEHPSSPFPGHEGPAGAEGAPPPDEPDGAAPPDDDPDGTHAVPADPAGTAASPPPDEPDGPDDPDDLAGFEPTMSGVFRRLRPVVGIVVALAMLVPAGGWALDRLAVRSAGGAVQEALGDDAAITESLLLVRSVDCVGRSRSGSAFSLEHEGTSVVVTNRHVVEAARSTVVQPLEAGPGAQVREVRLSAIADVAVLVLDAEVVPPALPVGSDATLGQPILTVGFPGARPTLREGRIDRIEPGRLLLALEVGAGASGSPVLDEDARVVGQVFARTRDGRGVATPVTDLLAAVADATPAPDCT